MSAPIKLAAARPHQILYAMCVFCDFRWLCIAPTGVNLLTLECPDCKSCKSFPGSHIGIFESREEALEAFDEAQKTSVIDIKKGIRG